jgi:hypothetical protein
MGESITMKHLQKEQITSQKRKPARYSGVRFAFITT